MPTYPVKNNKTGEKKEIEMTIPEYTEWLEQNPDWSKDWQAGCAASVSGTGDVYSRTDGGWNEVLSRVSQMPGSKVKPQKITHI
jgi:hypothetical protein|tara:strand:- start:49 stop:300 length:252 start_codon:yes stop_codon:yes gene_type:complete